jgi:1-acyl-sn-glycerol-3-phosphate acyltransferase
MIVAAIRSVLFYILFFAQTVPLALIIGTAAAIQGRTRWGWSLVLYWIHSSRWLLRHITGIRSDVTGGEHIPDGPCIIAAKHMSDWDIFAILPDAERPAFIAKKELMDIPFFGHAARAYDTIRIDRSKGSEAMPLMLADARAALDRGARIIIFPEGTRKAPLADPDYRWGVVRLYEELGVPVVPVALNSGLFWGRNSLLLWPGTARARFLKPIPPGLSPEAFRETLMGAIDTETDRLILTAVEEGLRRPVSADLARRIDALRARAGR